MGRGAKGKQNKSISSTLVTDVHPSKGRLHRGALVREELKRMKMWEEE